MKDTIQHLDRTSYILESRRIVLKLGTKVLLKQKKGESDALNRLASDVARFRKQGYLFTIVTSGAVGFGMDALKIETRPTDLQKIQALASIGQGLLMQSWNAIFSEQGLNTSQILLTYDIIENRKRYLLTRDCFRSVFEYGAVPIVNENDSVAVDELKFGDNDTLSALTAILMDADLLILFTDTDGVYTRNPHKHSDTERIPFIEHVDDSIFNLIEDKQNAFSLGGMKSKLIAAQRSAQVGTGVIITQGFDPDLGALLQGADIGTFIRPQQKYEKKRKRWIFFNHKIKGKIIVDRGAEEALVHHFRSLLPGGILRTEGVFEKDCIVGIYNLDEALIGKGITNYTSSEIEEMKGQRTDQIKAVRGPTFVDEVIDRDNMIVI
jgi:glutamate 5-kinase